MGPVHDNMGQIWANRGIRKLLFKIPLKNGSSLTVYMDINKMVSIVLMFVSPRALTKVKWTLFYFLNNGRI